MKLTVGKFDIEEYAFDNGLKEICITINQGNNKGRSGLFSVEKFESAISQFYDENE